MTSRAGPARWSRLPDLLAAVLAVAAVGVAARWGSFVAGGSDSYCYVALARGWLDGSVFRPVATTFPLSWTNGPLSVVPAGFTPSPVIPGGMAPICSPGLSLLMAAAERLAGSGAAFAVVPVFGALTVWSAFTLGRHLVDWRAGLLAAVTALCSPVFLFQLLQPMSDVPAAALWLMALALVAPGTLWGHAGSGLMVGAAIAVRPNLLPLAIPFVLLLLLARQVSSWSLRVRRSAVFAVATLPGLVATLWMNALFYGSPFSSGYGDPALLFQWSHVSSNVVRYPQWLLESQTLWIVLGLASPFILRNTAAGTGRSYSPVAMALTALGVLAMGLVVYLPYVVFDSWTYLRFLLPGVLLLVVTSAAVTVGLFARAPRRLQAVALCLVAAGLAGWFVKGASERYVFDLAASEARFIEAGEWIDRHLPQEAVVLTTFQSGSVRLYGRRQTVLWDAIEPMELDDVIDSLRTNGYRPFLLLERWEVAPFRARFTGYSAVSALDWPPRVQIGREVEIFDPVDRARFYAGERIGTQRVIAAAERGPKRRR